MACTTASGPDPGKSCAFPYFLTNPSGTGFFNISCCTPHFNPAGTTEPWCPTMLDESGFHVDQSKWGTCEAECYPGYYYGTTPSKFVLLTMCTFKCAFKYISSRFWTKVFFSLVFK